MRGIASTAEAYLPAPIPTARSSARPTPACSRARCAPWCSTGRSTAKTYISHPMQDLRAQSAADPSAAGSRIFQACAADQGQLLRLSSAAPIPGTPSTSWSTGRTRLRSRLPATPPDPRPVKGDDILAIAPVSAVCAERRELGQPRSALADELGDGSGFRSWSARTGTAVTPIRVSSIPIPTIATSCSGAIRAEVPAKRAMSASISEPARTAGQFDHVYVNCGYDELNYGLWPIHAHDVFRGPFRVPSRPPRRWSSPSPQPPRCAFGAVSSSHATSATTRLLHDARRRGTGLRSRVARLHRPAVEGLIDRVLPPTGTKCKQEESFPEPELLTRRQAPTQRRCAPTLRGRLRSLARSSDDPARARA